MKRLTKKYTIGMINSKEALEQIKNHLYAILKLEAPELIHHYDNKFAIVEKDLEVLEILKKSLCIEFTDDGEFQPDVEFIAWKDESTTINSRDNPEEFNKVKEWLER